MKNTKLTKFLTLFLALCVAVTTFGAVAFADEGDDETAVTTTYRYEEKFSGDNFTTERLAIVNPFDYFNAYEVTGDEEKQVEFKLSVVDELKVFEADDGFVVKGDEHELTDGKEYILKKDDNTIQYNYADNESDEYFYVVEAKIGEETYRANVKAVRFAGDKLSYKDFSEDSNLALLEAARAAVKDAVKDGKTSFELPADKLWDLVDSEVLPRTAVQILTYVVTPRSSDPTSATYTNTDGKYHTISTSATGTYYFWVLYGNGEYDEWNRYTMSTEGLDRKTDGFYEGDKLIIPIFSFDYKADNKVTVSSSGGGEDGVVNYTYDSIIFTVKNGTVINDGLTLEYSADNTTWGKAVAYDAEKDNTVEAHAKFDATKFTASSISFTPLKTGYFRVKCMASGLDGNDSDTVVEYYSKTVTVNRELAPVKYVDTRVRDFFKNNWQSLMFLGLAVLSLVGIIVIALYKPKNPDGKKKKVEVKEEPAEEATEEVKDESPATEEAEENTEEAEETPAEEVSEEPATEENPVEEAKDETPIEEPAEEESKPTEPTEEAAQAEEPEQSEEKPAEEEKAEQGEEPKAE